MSDIKIMYVCNQQKACNASIFCGKECTHTADINYAKNFTFETLMFKNDTTYLYEERINDDK